MLLWLGIAIFPQKSWALPQDSKDSCASALVDAHTRALSVGTEVTLAAPNAQNSFEALFVGSFFSPSHQTEQVYFYEYRTRTLLSIPADDLLWGRDSKSGTLVEIHAAGFQSIDQYPLYVPQGQVPQCAAFASVACAMQFGLLKAEFQRTQVLSWVVQQYYVERRPLPHVLRDLAALHSLNLEQVQETPERSMVDALESSLSAKRRVLLVFETQDPRPSRHQFSKEFSKPRVLKAIQTPLIPSQANAELPIRRHMVLLLASFETPEGEPMFLVFDPNFNRPLVWPARFISQADPNSLGAYAFSSSENP